MSLIFPTLATARASRNLCTYEYTPGGLGLNYETIWWTYHNYKIITYYFIMIYAFVLYFSIGMLFENYGSVPEIIRSLKLYFFPKKKDEVFSKLDSYSSDEDVFEVESY